MSHRELLIGCGHSRKKRVIPPYTGIGTLDSVSTFQNLTTLDVNPKCKPDIVADLIYSLQWSTFPADNDGGIEDDNAYDEIHAYEVLEHIGRQGNYITFFTQFGELWRILKPNGYLCATVPHWRSVWAWGDPGHTCIINEGTLVFLDQREYERQLGKTAMSDYREELGPTNFHCVRAEVKGELLEFVLRAIK